MSITLSGVGIIILPSPDKENSEALDIRVDSKRSMNGTRYTYVKSNTEKQFSLTFSSIDRDIMIDLETFHKANAGLRFTFIDHLNVVHNVVFADDTLSFITDKFASSGAPKRGEFGSLTLTLIGT